MTTERAFINILFDVILLECGFHSKNNDYHYPLQNLIDVFVFLRQLFKRTKKLRYNGAERYIGEHHLDLYLGLCEDMPILNGLSHFPSHTGVLPSPMSRFKDNIYLLPWGSFHVDMFLHEYAKDVPSYYHDEIPFIVHNLRITCWRDKGDSGGDECILADGSTGVGKYSRKHCAQMRQRAEELEFFEKEFERDVLQRALLLRDELVKQEAIMEEMARQEAVVGTENTRRDALLETEKARREAMLEAEKARRETMLDVEKSRWEAMVKAENKRLEPMTEAMAEDERSRWEPILVAEKARWKSMAEAMVEAERIRWEPTVATEKARWEALADTIAEAERVRLKAMVEAERERQNYMVKPEFARQGPMVNAKRQEQEQRRLEREAREACSFEMMLVEKQQQQEIEEQHQYRAITVVLDQLKQQSAATADIKRNVETLLKHLEATLCLYPDLQNAESGLCTTTSDADFTILNFVAEGPRPINRLAGILRAAGYGLITMVSNARVPIISFTRQGLHCDISINQPMGVINSRLINAYQRIDSRFMELWLGLRTLANKHGILSGSTGYLPSYSLTMVLIVFLQYITSLALLPRLQQQNADKIQEHQVGRALLTNFCEYFGYTYDYSALEINPHYGVIRNRSVPPPSRTQTDNRPKDWAINMYFVRDLAIAFTHIHEMFINNPNLKFPGDAFIQQLHLYTRAGLSGFMDALPNSNGSHFPYATPIRKSPLDYTGNNDYIVLPACSSRQVNDFLQSYAVNVPSAYHDSIAAIVMYLRLNCWRNRRGSGGSDYVFSDGMMCVAKYSNSHNATKRYKAERLKAQGTEQEQLQQEQRAQDEATRLAEMRSQERRNEQIKTELYRLQHGKHQARHMAITRFLDKLKLQAATADIKSNVETLRRNLENILRRQPELRNAEQGLHCDMSINQPMGVFNSQLINAYREIDTRFLGLWFGLRYLAGQYRILGGSTGYLSSYALTMMLIVFLQDVTSPPILPKLQQQSADKMHASTIDGYHCAYDRDPRNYTGLAAKNNKLEGELLEEFCTYFGFTFNYTTQEVNPRLGVIRNRSVPPPPRTRTDSRPKDWPICILDPFLTTRNVAGNCRSSHVANIQMCFRSASAAFLRNEIDKAFKK
ncbi:Zinc finger, CCHC domain-containing protein [Mortierella sp. 14UC]|nr:Zinc finger, CCHC domain-containing protein [Mortierella sp. 14UC]